MLAGAAIARSRTTLIVKKTPEEEFVNLVKQTYQVLLTRGMKGCYVYFEDAATREFFVSCTKTEEVFSLDITSLKRQITY